WYQAGQPDKAIEPYEKALALQPKRFDVRNNVVLAHTLARLGSIADHRRRAIEVAEASLKLVPTESFNWARAQNSLGTAWKDLPTGDRTANLRQAIAAHEAALTVDTKDAFPPDWASTQI